MSLAVCLFVLTQTSWKMSSNGDEAVPFSTAIKLLHSPAEGSADALRALLDSAIEKRYGKEKTLTKVLPTPPTVSENTKKTCNKQDEAKGQRVSEPKGEKRKSKEHKDKSKNKVTSVSEQKKSVVSDTAAEKLPFPLQGDVPKCVICKQATKRDTLLECQECQKLYHQGCHRPPVLEIDISDPRLVWYCDKCKNVMKKAASATITGRSTADPVATPQETTQKTSRKTEEEMPFRATKDLLGAAASKSIKHTTQPDLSAWFSKSLSSGQQTSKPSKHCSSATKSVPSSPTSGSKKSSIPTSSGAVAKTSTAGTGARTRSSNLQMVSKQTRLNTKKLS